MDRMRINRRQLLGLFGSLGAGSVLAASGIGRAVAGNQPPRITVIGGGFGGATAAKYLKRFDPSVHVTLIEPSRRYYTCPFSNLYLGGLYDFEDLGHGYRELARDYGVQVIHSTATDIDTEQRTVTLAGDETLRWDRLILSPGIDIRWGELEGYTRDAAELAPHAWKAGPQTHLLKKQLESMEDGGTFILVAPQDPFRCPPGPYERGSMVANYFKNHKPKSKILLLDAKDNFSKQPLFQQGWQENYGDMIEWVSRSNDGTVIRVDAANREVETEFGTRHKADVLNVVPPQKAGFIADRAGVTDDSGWVPIEPRTFRSPQADGVYVIGDATQAAPMPKSGFVANTQGKSVAAAVLADLAGEETPDPSWANTCYSTIAPGYGISVAGVYGVRDGEIEEFSGGISPEDADGEFRRKEAEHAVAWYEAIAQDTWGTYQEG